MSKIMKSKKDTNFSPPLYKPAIPSATRLGVSLANGSNCQASDLEYAGTQLNKMDLEKVAQGVHLILEGIGENVNREGLLDTPARVARMYQELCYGIGVDCANELTTTFSVADSELVLVRDIQFASVCEHHLVPFMGVAHVGYIPKAGQITGLSKLARVVEVASKRPQVQEKMTTEIADALEKKLSPQGVIVVIEAEHLCMSIRGIHKPGSRTVTSSVRGIFESNQATRAEAMSLIVRG